MILDNYFSTWDFFSELLSAKFRLLLAQNDHVQSDQQAFYYIEKAVDQVFLPKCENESPDIKSS